MNKLDYIGVSGRLNIVRVTGGYPTFKLCEETVLKMAKNGASAVEIAIPFSDPVAEDRVRQEENLIALTAGSTVGRIFELTASVSEKSGLPTVLLSYLNPILAFGYDEFMESCGRSGVSGILVADLPLEESGELRSAAADHGIRLLSHIAPAPSSRIREIARSAEGYLTLVGFSEKTDLGAIISAVRAVSPIPIVADCDDGAALGLDGVIVSPSAGCGAVR